MLSREQKPGNLVQTIERVANIFEVMAQNTQGISLKELSARVSLPKGTIHRLLSSLAYFGYVRQASESKNYQLGFKLVELGNSLLNQLDVRVQARPFLVGLSKGIKETIHLVVFDQNEALYVDKVESDEKLGGLQMVSRVGTRIPAHCSSVGKVFLAHLSDSQLDTLIKEKGLTKRTKNTITDPEKLTQHLKVIRQQGYAVDDEENEKGIRCVGAPIFNQRGQVIAAISISGPAVRITQKIIQQTLRKEVLQTALDISREMGYQN